jgi:hypothetical protein
MWNRWLKMHHALLHENQVLKLIPNYPGLPREGVQDTENKRTHVSDVLRKPENNRRYSMF